MSEPLAHMLPASTVHAVLDLMPDPVLAVAPDGTVTYTNPACNALLPSPPAPPVENDVDDVQEKAGQDRAPDLARGPDPEIQKLYTTDAGPVWIAWKPFRGLAGPGASTPDDTYFIGRDITQTKQDAQKQIDRRIDAEAANSAKSAFLAVMSHEIRTPMNGVLGMARLLLDTELTSEQRDYAEKIDKSGDALLSILNDILDYSKIEAGHIELDETRFVIEDLIQDIVELFAPKAHEKGIEIASAIAHDIPHTVIGDAAKIRQIIINLANNAVKFTNSGGVIVRVRNAPVPDQPSLSQRADENPRVRIEVSDTGIGIPEDALANIFDEFTHADSSHATEFGGSGLGLAISKKLLTALGGEIGVTSNPGHGTTFWIDLPCRWADALPHHAHGTKLIGLTAMVVSANPVIAEAVEAQLSIAHAKTMIVSSTQEAIRILKSEAADTPTTILYDLAADPDDAAIFAHQFQRTAPDGCRCLLMLTPQNRHHIDPLMRLGFRGYLLKPLRQNALIERIQYAHDLVDTQAEIVTINNRLSAEKAPSSRAKTPLDILVAEDNDINRALIVSLLTKAGHTATHVSNGKDVLTKLGEKSFDLILMDVRMPHMDGLAATRKIRAGNAAWADIPVIALTANAMEEDRKAAAEAGMNDFVTKPIDPGQLHRLIERWTNQSPPVKVPKKM